MLRGFIKVSLQLAREGDKWLGRCPELGTSMFGDTMEEALAELKEAILLHLTALEDAGELERFLEEQRIECLRDFAH